MSFGKSSAPSAPNYQQLAQQTADASREGLLLQTGLNRPTEINPYGSRQWALRPGADPNNPQAGDWVVADTLSPNQQNILNLREGTQIGMGQAAQAGTGRLQEMMSTGVDPSTLPSRYQGDIPMSESAFSADRNRVEGSVYDRMTRFYDQQFGEDEAALRSRLSNSGLMEGSEAYDKALRDFNQQKQGAYADAASRAIEAGGAEQSRQYGNLLSAVGAADARRSNALGENLTLRQLPLNEMNALLSGTQLGGQGGGAAFANAGLAQTPDYLGAGQAQYQAALDRTNARNAGTGNFFNNLTTLGSAWLSSSDRRLKSNISRIGTHPKLGIGVYEYDIADRREVGVMADELESVMPTAVHYGPDGYAKVDYAMVRGAV